MRNQSLINKCVWLIIISSFLLCLGLSYHHYKQEGVTTPPKVDVQQADKVQAGHVILTQESSNRPQDLHQAQRIVQRIEKRQYEEVPEEDIKHIEKKTDYVIQHKEKNYYINEDKQRSISAGMAYINNRAMPNINYTNKRLSYTVYLDKNLRDIEGVGVNYVIKRW